MVIREVTGPDWPASWPIYREIADAGETYALPAARTAGFASMQFNAVVETNTVAVRLWQAEAFAHPAHGLVGRHVMYRRL